MRPLDWRSQKIVKGKKAEFISQMRHGATHIGTIEGFQYTQWLFVMSPTFWSSDGNQHQQTTPDFWARVFNGLKKFDKEMAFDVTHSTPREIILL
jgi:hypothetical protein